MNGRAEVLAGIFSVLHAIAVSQTPAAHNDAEHSFAGCCTFCVTSGTHTQCVSCRLLLCAHCRKPTGVCADCDDADSEGSSTTDASSGSSSLPETGFDSHINTSF